ncbi:hypothetical protein FRACYDRAFT_257009 [Fragilariopsis cylindrus CCMP1102]|uniref:Sulfotransferase domain-containing protein n=1 Tax=Fragilariopsis cylindrus CCMP1102 TaxID=635003 RepID=A0A1E7EJC5_9STRA|nr:hypothetical protein FRACYDRAFT_257009 [Fragilariopsis cylindrus CCMP1102]|eukprot:OEU06006.1 hypothetical protein FRACYDRAFT_257009 [Fragilariopsis cylindrus CCMP1102]
MCSTIRDAFNNKLEHCGLSTPMTPEPEPVPTTNTNTDTDTTHHPVVVVDSVVDSDSDSDSFTEQQQQIGGYNNNTLPIKILQKIPLKEQIQLNTLKRRMIQRFQEKNVIGRCTEARRNPELRYNHSMYLTEDHYTTVLIVRDPFERAYSAYKNSDSNINISLNNDDDDGGDLMGFKNGIPKEHINSSSSASKNNNANGSSSSRSSKRKHSGRLQQQKDDNNATITTTTTIDNNNSDRILKLFESISSKTMNQLAIFYKDDLKLWQELLDYGTPRSSSPGEEITLYDYYLLSDQKQIKLERKL